MPDIKGQVYRPFVSEELPVFAGYRSVRKLGTGAGSVIIAVQSEKDGKILALKHVVRTNNSAGKRLIEQVENEYQIARQINHPYIRKVYDIKRIRKRLQTREIYLLMEYCPGVSLEQSRGRSLLDLLLTFRMVCDGLNGMHSAGFIHCDIKPNNIIIGEDGSVRIIDLGQSCPIGTVKSRIQGTPDYIAPEQVKRRPLSKQTDVFNLGATMYWALTGKHVPTLIPKKRDRLSLAKEEYLAAPPTPHELRPKIPLGVSNLVMDCIQKSPHSRPQDMPTLSARLDLLIHMIAGGRPLGASNNNGKNGSSDSNKTHNGNGDNSTSDNSNNHGNGN